MGLKLEAQIRNEWVTKYGAARTARSSGDIYAETAVIDVSACCRQTVASIVAETKTSIMSPRAVAKKLYARYTRPHPDATTIVFVFDSPLDMHPLRHMMYEKSRYSAATPERLANLRTGEVAVGNRIFKYTQRPYVGAETELWDLDTPVDSNRMFSSSKAKQAVYSMMAEEIVCLAAEHTGTRMTIVDTIKTHSADNAVITIVTDAADGVTVTPSSRQAKHGEADNKCAHYYSTQHPLRGKDGVWYTCDTDAIVSCVLLKLQCNIAMPNLKVIDPSKLPQGPNCAIALLCNGGDYNENVKYAQISSAALLKTLEHGVPEIMSVSESGIDVDTGALWQFLAGEQPPRRRRNVFVLDGDEPHVFYRMRASAQQAALAQGISFNKIRSRVPSAAMIAHTVSELLRSVAYYYTAQFLNSSDTGMLDELYPALIQCFANASAPTNVGNLVAAASNTGRVLARFGI